MIQQLYPQVQHNFQFELNKDMHLAAAHYIPHEGAGKCQNIHGHTYFINITIAGDELDHSGFLVNFASIKKLIHNRFDHTILNEHTDLFSKDNPNYFPTTEGVARAIWEVVQKELDTKANQPKCVQVFVRETPTSYVVFRPRRKEGHA